MSLPGCVYIYERECDRIAFTVTIPQSQRMIAKRQVRHSAGRLRVTGIGEMLLAGGLAEGGRTHTSRGELMGAAGRSQHYTIEDTKGWVHDFKRIALEDRHIFQAAALGLDV